MPSRCFWSPSSCQVCQRRERADRAAHLGVSLEPDHRLERLEAVALDAGPDCLSADAVEVNEYLTAEQLVELVLAYPVARDELLERGGFVGVEVEDVQVGVVGEPICDPAEPLLDRLFLLAARPRPQRPVLPFGVVFVRGAEQVLKPVLAPVRVTLEVEEHVARRWLGKTGEAAAGLGLE